MEQRRPVPPDVEGDAERFLHWAESEEWLRRGEYASPAVSSTWGFGPAHAASVSGKPEDPWMAALDTGTGDFCEVPAATLRSLRLAGEAQLAEISALREQVGRSRDMGDEIRRMEAQLREMETSLLVTGNEADLRQLEVKHLESEVERLSELHAERAKRAKELRLQNEQMERWLPGPSAVTPQSGNAPSGRHRGPTPAMALCPGRRLAALALLLAYVGEALHHASSPRRESSAADRAQEEEEEGPEEGERLAVEREREDIEGLVAAAVRKQQVGCISGFGGYFPSDEINTCPTGWTCSHNYVVVRGGPGLGREENLGTNDGVNPMVSVCHDGTQGTFISTPILLPSNAATLRYQHSGGADPPSNGVYVYSEGGTEICFASRGHNSDYMAGVDCNISAGAGQAVFIMALCTQKGSWSKVWVTDFHVLDSNDTDITDSITCASSSSSTASRPTGIGASFPQWEVETCPSGWTCRDNHTVVKGVGSENMYHGEIYATSDGVVPMVAVCDNEETGTFTSDPIILPAAAATMRYQHSGGAEPPDGVYVLRNGTEVCFAGRGANSDYMASVDCNISGAAGQEVTIEARCNSTGNWQKVWVSDFRILDSEGNDLSGSVVFATTAAAAAAQGQASVVGDPHVVSVAGARFEIRAGGAHKLVQIPRLVRANETPDLRVDASIEHLAGTHCGMSFMTSLSISGRWTGDAPGPLRITRGSDMPNTTLLINARGPEEYLRQSPLPGAEAGHASIAFRLGDVSFHVGKHFEGRYGRQQAYLNVRIVGLRRYGDVGGLLGYDDHADAEKPAANCTAAQPAAADQSSFIGARRPVPGTGGGSRIEAE